MTSRRLFFEGARDCVPMCIGAVPFAVIAGAMARQAGFSVLESSAVSLVVFAGAAQLAAVELLTAGASYPVILLTTLLVNLRFALYSASLAPHFSGQPRALRGLMAGLLTDHAYALSVVRFKTLDAGLSRVVYFFGVAAPLWVVWQLGSVAGAIVGGKIAGNGLLGLAVPFCFVALLVPHLGSRSQVACALGTGLVLVLLRDLPAGINLMVAIGVGIGTGLLVERRWT